MNPQAYIDMDKTESNHWWFTARRLIMVEILKSLNLSADAKILEIGCGTGGNLNILSEFGKVSAIEMDANAHEIASEKTNNSYDIRVGSFPSDIPFKDEKFDLICMLDVLEHIENDTQTLIEIQKLLTPSGKIFITVPAYQWLYGVHDKFLHHKRRYSAETLSRRIPSGLVITKISYFNMFLFPLAVMVRLKDKFANNTSTTGTDLPPKIINKLFEIIFRSERYLLKYLNLPFGLSLFCVINTTDKR